MALFRKQKVHSVIEDLKATKSRQEQVKKREQMERERMEI